MNRALSGIKPTGEPTLGSYLGAIKNWVELADEYDDVLLFIPDLHALNAHPEPEDLKDSVLSNLAWLLASGVDLDKTKIFLQSQISAHSELFNILNNYVTMGELSRMTQFKDKSQNKQQGAWVGLFEYPVLMAADILLYDANDVPVGDDQIQHVELTRDIAERFNNRHGDVFKIPNFIVKGSATRVMDLQNPDNKMSKSESQSGTVLLADNKDEIVKQFKRAVTDSGQEIVVRDDKPGVSNLINIFSALSGDDPRTIEDKYKDSSYGDFKRDLADLAVSVITPIQSEYKKFIQDKQGLLDVLSSGKAYVQPIATKKLQQIKNTIGLIE